MIVSIIIIAAIISIIVVKTSLSSITQLGSSDIALKGESVKYYTEGCMQEALIQLNRDNTYSGGVLNLGSGSCNVSVSGADNSRTVDVTGDLNNYYHNIIVDVVLDPFSISTWDN